MMVGFKPEQELPNPEACGMGQGADCCIFLTMGPNGFNCEAETKLGVQITLKSLSGGMTSARIPVETYPECQIGVVV